jgi:hypothetical protein
MKSSFHNIIPFLLFLFNHLRPPSPELDSVLDNNYLKRPSLSLYDPSVRTTQKTQTLYYWEGLPTDPLSRNRRPIVARVGYRGNVIITESLPCSGSMRHNIFWGHEMAGTGPGSYPMADFIFSNTEYLISVRQHIRIFHKLINSKYRSYKNKE